MTRRATSPSPITITNHKATGFTLVELAIVIVIIGLLVGGVMAGQSLIRSSEVQNVTKTIEGYKSAALTYKTKFNALPGDDQRAYDWFGAACDATPSNCNGDGDGLIPENSSANDSEALRFWQHLVLGKFLKGNFLGTANGGWGDVLRGVVLPKLSFKDVYISVENRNHSYAPLGFSYNNFFISGKAINAGILRPVIPYLNTVEAIQIDTKLDDGKPWSGSVFVVPSWSSVNVNCVSSSNYNIAYTNEDGCHLMFGW